MSLGAGITSMLVGTRNGLRNPLLIALGLHYTTTLALLKSSCLQHLAIYEALRHYPQGTGIKLLKT